jgi:hypothetical protein
MVGQGSISTIGSLHFRRTEIKILKIIKKNRVFDTLRQHLNN